VSMKYQKKQQTIVGIDYSLNSPAICIAGDNFDFNKCSFHFLTSKKKHIGKFGKNIFGYEIKEYNTAIERFNNISLWALDTIHKNKTRQETAQVFIEGYSFGSKGQAVFQIAENCGLLKYKLHMSPTMLYDTIVPSVVKKYASGKGNADKQLMYDSFKEYTKQDLLKMFDMGKLNNPVTDIIDSYYIAKVGYENIKSKK
jgi:Holliday junction resolvasome RuvABC endonuclease subunit